jgi:photosystem II stability/assembly factor-like uncharacterized protein
LMEARFGGETAKARHTAASPLTNAVTVPTWQELGPLNMTDPGQTTAYEPSQGRMNVIAADASNPQHLYAGAASGGVWVTTDGGTTWSPRAQNLPVITVSSIVVDPNNGNTVYVATGDADGRNTPSVGVYKSTDGGNSWTVTGLTYPLTAFSYITKLAIDPTTAAKVYAAATDGVYYTRNGGTTWTKVSPDGGTSNAAYRDIKIRPGSPATVYSVNDAGAVYRSTDSGATWQAATGLPDPVATQRAVIAVTAADPNLVYLLAASNTDLLLYKSIDAGGSFRPIPSTTLKDFAAAQATFYDLAFAVSPTNVNELMAGVISVFRSTDGGATWFYTSSGPNATANPIVHVDQHYIEYINSAIYDCSDGGLHRSADGGVSWANLSPTLGVGQIYQVSGSKQNPNLIFIGEQDDGFNRYNGAKWEHFNAGDFGRVAVDPTNDQIVYASANFGLFKYTDINMNPTPLKVTTAEQKRFEGAVIVINPANPQVLYAGYQNVHRSVDGGASWKKVSNFTDSQVVDTIVLAPSDPKTIYVGRSNGFSPGSFYRSTNEGATFTDISAGLPDAVTGVAIDPKNPMRLWVSLQGGNTNAVYSSQNGGATWVNYSGTALPNSSTRSIVYETGSQDALYVGTVAGVYYRDAMMNNWQSYNKNLPNVIVNSLEIDYNSKKLRAGTYGRGLWQANLASGGVTNAQFLNISTRLKVQTGTAVSIGGFIVTGSDAKKVLVRGIGPSLAARGVQSPLGDPTLELHDTSKLLASNDNWKKTQQSEVQATGVPPANEAESAIVATVAGNTANYTAVLAGKNGGTGVGLVEVYDLAQAANSKLANISTRGFVDTGDNVMIGGFILGPGGTGSARVLLRAIGPSLARQGVANALVDPVLELHGTNGAVLATNDNWKDTQQAEIQATGIPPTSDSESAIVRTLPPGSYTAVLRGKNNGTGTALVEAYNLP